MQKLQTEEIDDDNVNIERTVENIAKNGFPKTALRLSFLRSQATSKNSSAYDLSLENFHKFLSSCKSELLKNYLDNGEIQMSSKGLVSVTWVPGIRATVNMVFQPNDTVQFSAKDLFFEHERILTNGEILRSMMIKHVDAFIESASEHFN